MNSREDLYKGNAIRVLAKIIDATMLGAIERSVRLSFVGCCFEVEMSWPLSRVAMVVEPPVCPSSTNQTTPRPSTYRYLKQAIVDRNPMVASSALVAGMHLMHKSPEIVRRWCVVWSLFFPLGWKGQGKKRTKPAGPTGPLQHMHTNVFTHDATQINPNRVNEVQEAVNSPSSSEMVQFQALSLLHEIKQKDRLAVSKVQQQIDGRIAWPLSGCVSMC